MEDFDNGLPGKPMTFIMLISLLIAIGIIIYGLWNILFYILTLLGV